MRRFGRKRHFQVLLILFGLLFWPYFGEIDGKETHAILKNETKGKPGRLSFYLDVSDAEHLKAEAERLDVTVSELIRAILQAAGLDDLESVHRGSREGIQHPNYRHGRRRGKAMEINPEETVVHSPTGKPIRIRLNRASTTEGKASKKIG